VTSSLRIIGGRLRSRRLGSPVPSGVRPTGDKLRETLFNVIGDRVTDSVFLDAYAGVGAVGIEAISRGAAMVYFVDRASLSTSAIRANLSRLEISEGCRVMQMDLDRALRICLRDGVLFDIVFLDPPYRRADFYQRDLERLGRRPLLLPEALVVAEHRRSQEMPESAGRLRRERTLDQGDSTLTFYRPEDE
jgi:16S rRNA (guanine966-N2)-methyltransferase